MGALDHVPKVILSVTAIALSAIYLSKSNVSIEVDSSMCRLNEMSEVKQMDSVEDNKVMCSLGAFSNIVLLMQEDGYAIESESSTLEHIDVLLGKKDLKFRLLYKRTKGLVVFCNRYEKSYIPLTYIYEER